MKKRELWKKIPVEVERDNKGRFVSWRKLTLEDLQISLFEKEANYRYTVGTNFSDRNIPVSFSGYFFKTGEEFTYVEEKTCFLIFFREMFKILYPKKNYDYYDFVVGWDTPIREEHNAQIQDPEVEDHSFRVEWNQRGVPQTGVEGIW